MTGKTLTAEEIQSGAQEYGHAIDSMIYMNLIPVIAAGYSAQNFMGPNGTFLGQPTTSKSIPTNLSDRVVTSSCTFKVSSLSLGPLQRWRQPLECLGMVCRKQASTFLLRESWQNRRPELSSINKFVATHHIIQTMGATTGNSLETRVKRRQGRQYRQFAAQLDTMSVVGILPTTIDTPSNRQANPNTDTESWTKPHDIAVEIGKWVDTPQLRPHSGALVKVTSTGEGSIFDIVR